MAQAPQHVFITGITGSLGSAIARYFLNDPGTYVYALIRAKTPQHLQERVDALFAFWGDDITVADARTRLVPLLGDAAKDGFDLDNTTYTMLTTKITHIIHSAATIKLNMGEEEAVRKVLAPSKQIIVFAKKCNAEGQFKKLEYVSTIGVAGRATGMVVETPLPHIKDFHNNYERFKSQCEGLVVDEVKAGLPATLHRPSMIVGDSTTGKLINFQGFYLLCEFLSGKMTAGFLPICDGLRLDLVPADFVAKAIYYSSQSADSVGRIMHLCAGIENTMPIREFTARVREHFQQTQSLPRLHYMPTRTFLWVLKTIQYFMPGHIRKAIGNLFLFADYLEHPQQFDTMQTQHYYSALNLRSAAPNDYLTHVFDYYLEHKR